MFQQTDIFRRGSSIFMATGEYFQKEPKIWWTTSVTAKEKSFQQKKNSRGKKKITRRKKKKITAKEKLLRQKKITHRKRQKNTTKGHDKKISRNKMEKSLCCVYMFRTGLG